MSSLIAALPCFHLLPPPVLYIFFFNDTATTEIYTLSLHDALPISRGRAQARAYRSDTGRAAGPAHAGVRSKSTRLNSSHSQISYAVFCLKKKKQRLVKRGTDQPRPCA